MTARIARFFSLPLLAKELTEAAARRRTYITRVLYAVLLYALFALQMPRWLWQPGTSPLQAMGAGRQLFEQLMMLQLAGIALFLPALMCGRIAQEKERDSLVLLLLTELRPWQIVLQKYAGGLVPMLTFLLLGMPLAAIAYAFGGVTAWKLFGDLYALIVTCLQVGAIALFCSAWCRTTVGAFLATYFLGALFYAGPPVIYYIVGELTYSTPNHRGWWWVHREFSFGLIPAFGIENLIQVIETMRQIGGNPAAKARIETARLIAVLMMLPPLLSIAFFLLLARLSLVRRAFAPPSNFFLNIFRSFDRIMKRSNRLVGNVMLVRERENLPGDQPIYWRETARRALGKVHYLVRILVVVEIPTVFLCGMFANVDSGGHTEFLSVVATFLMALATIALSVQAANTIVSERVQQTLEVLLTTPLSGRDIVRQKARALGRLAWVAAVPLLTVFGTECWLEADMRPRSSARFAGWEQGDGWLAYAVCAVSMVAIYLPMIIWLSLWIGLRVRTRFRAIVTALVTLVLWCGLPLFAMFTYFAMNDFGEAETNLTRSIGLLSPLLVGFVNEEGDLHEFPWEIGSPWPVIAFNAVFYGAITLLLRRHALTNADRWLRR